MLQEAWILLQVAQWKKCKCINNLVLMLRLQPATLLKKTLAQCFLRIFLACDFIKKEILLKIKKL